MTAEKPVGLPDFSELEPVLESYPVEGALFFGSGLTGPFWKESDWDILLISPDFEGHTSTLLKGSRRIRHINLVKREIWDSCMENPS